MTATSRDLEHALAVLALEHHVLSPADAVRLLGEAQSGEQALATLVLERVPDHQLLPALATELGVTYADLQAPASAFTVDDAAVREMDLTVLMSRLVLPLRGPGDRPAAAMANPHDTDMLEYLRSVQGAEPVVALVSPAQIRAKLVQFDGPAIETGQVAGTAPNALPTSVEDNPVLTWTDNMLVRAAAERASDVSLVFEADGSLLVRFRVDSTWRVQRMPLRGREREVIGALLSKCETIDASDRTRPQDGTFAFANADGRAVDVRVNMLPQAHGPGVVLRLLDPTNINRRLDDMGFRPDVLAQMRRVMASPQGAVLFVGPTGCGKTTTMYTLLQELDPLALNILTVEDPIEYRLPHIGQTQVRSDLGDRSLTFARALRAMLRQAPNVILVGEIRDAETAEVATQFAMSGHLVLSTLHAKDALGVYQRLEGLGVDRFLNSQAVSMVVNQRLLRVLHECAITSEPTAGEAAALQRLNLPVPELLARPARGGCTGCGGTGYLGRTTAVEVLEPSAKLRDMVQQGVPFGDLESAAREEGHTSLLADAYRHVADRRTSVAELYHAIDTRSL